MTDNLHFYEMGAKVPKEACKDFNNGRFKGTDINRMWRVRKLTEMFGPVGIGWTFNLVETWERQIEGSTRVVIFAKGELKVKIDGEWSEPIIGYGGNDIVQYAKNTGETRINDEAYKMAGTDALGHACTFLGIGESVYWNEATKYTQSSNEEGEPKANTKEIPSKPTKDPFFGSSSTAKADKKESASLNTSLTGESAKADPVKPAGKSEMDEIFAAKYNAKTKDMVAQWQRDNNAPNLYEIVPEQRQQLLDMIRSVA